MALDQARIELAVDGAGTVQVLDKASASTEQVRLANARLSLELKGVETQLRLLKVAYDKNTDPRRAQQIVNETAALQQQQAALKGQIAALNAYGAAGRQAGGGVDQFGAQTRGASQTLIEFGRAANDSQQFAYGFRQGIVAISNQADGLIRGLSTLRQETGSWRGAAGALGRSLFTTTGIMAGLNLAITAAILLGPKLAEMFDRAGGSARKAREEVEDFFDAMVTFEGTDFDLGVTFGSADETRGVLSEIEARIGRLRRQTTILNDDIQRETSSTWNASLQEFVTSVSARGRALQAEQRRLRTSIAADEERAARLRERLREQETAADEQAALTSAGARTTAEVREAQQREREQERARERQERADVTAARRAERLAERTAEQQAELRRRLAEQSADIEADVRIEALEDETARALAEVDRRERERLARVQEALDEEAVTRERAEELNTQVAAAAARARADIHARALEAMYQEEARFRAMLREVEDVALELQGVREEFRLELAIERLEAEAAASREMLGEEHDTTQALLRELSVARMRYSLFVRGLLKEEAREASERSEGLAAKERGIRAEAERAAEASARRISTLFERALDTAIDALRRTREITDAEARLQRRAYDEDERELRASYARREIDAQEFADRMAVLNEERAAFNREVEEDRAGAFQRASGAIISALGEQIAKEIAAFAAGRAARFAIAQVFGAQETAAEVAKAAKIAAAYAPAATLASVATTGANAGIGGAAVLAALAAIAAAVAGMALFDKGGYTGSGERLKPAGIVHAGEFVLTKRATEGNVRDLYALMSALERGAKLRDLIRGFDLGGLVSQARVPAGYAIGGYVSAGPTGPTASDIAAAVASAVAPLAAEVGRLKARPAPVVIGPKETRLVEATAAADRARGRGAYAPRIRIARR